MHERHRKERLRLYLEQLQQDNILHHVSFLIKSRSKHVSSADNRGMRVSPNAAAAMVWGSIEG